MEEQIIEPADLTQIRPSKRQLQWQQLEFYGFIHFGLNTMTNREWGLGNESPTVFDPQNLDCHQWVSTMKQSGMQGIILTCNTMTAFAYGQASTLLSQSLQRPGVMVKVI